MANKKNSVIYYQILKEFFWPLGLETLEKWNITVKIIEKKTARFVKKDKIRDVKMLKPFHYQ